MKPNTPKVIITKKKNTKKCLDCKTKIPRTCHSIANFTVSGNPPNRIITAQIINRILVNLMANPERLTIFRVEVFFCIMSTRKNINVDNQPCIKIKRINPQSKVFWYPINKNKIKFISWIVAKAINFLKSVCVHSFTEDSSTPKKATVVATLILSSF
jgi:hypothetical protein